MTTSTWEPTVWPSSAWRKPSTTPVVWNEAGAPFSQLESNTEPSDHLTPVYCTRTVSPEADRRAVALLERLELEIGGRVAVRDLDRRGAVIGERDLGHARDRLLRLAPRGVRNGRDEVEDVDLAGVRVCGRVGHDDPRAGSRAAQDLADRVVGRDLDRQDGVSRRSRSSRASRRSPALNAGQRVGHELARFDRVPRALLDDRGLQRR